MRRQVYFGQLDELNGLFERGDAAFVSL